MKRAVIVSGGSIYNYDEAKKLCQNSYVICADSGALHCQKMNVKVNLWVGDFDSCSFDKLSESDVLKCADVIRLKPEKDDTDTEFACTYAVENGFDDIVLLGGCGTRLDHTLSNIFLLEKLNRFGVNITIYYKNNRLRMFENSTVWVKKGNYKYVSIIPIDKEAHGVTVSGFKYPLSNATLNRDSSRGVSNELIDQSGIISVKDGKILVIESSD